MDRVDPIYVLGCGAIGLPLAVFLANAGRKVIAVRTSSNRSTPSAEVTVRGNTGVLGATLEMLPLSDLTRLEGMIVITTKAYVNHEIARQLRSKAVSEPLVIMQNGLGVEKPFHEAGLSPVYRCILYATSQKVGEGEFTFRRITSSPIGLMSGDETGLRTCIEALTTEEFPFNFERNIQREIWKKAIVNTVFNSICPLLEVDNGIFAREEGTAGLAREVVRECVTLTDRLDLDLTEKELMEQILRISRRSTQLISTLQDIRNGRQTEINFLNLEIARIAASLQPRLELPRVDLLGKLILAKSLEHSSKE
jgi:2-dehydropantoate 2-reductase